MNSSAHPVRRIASNLLWTPQGLVRYPLVSLDAEGCMRSVEVCPEPDRMAATEFYAGLLVPGFPADFRAVFADMLVRMQTPLPEQLGQFPATTGGVLVVISGLDYTSLRLTPQSRILKLQPLDR